MTKLRRLDIVVTDPQTVYFPGQVIQGQVIVELSEAMKMRGIRIKAKGKGHVKWTEGSGDDKETHSASERYLNEVLILCGKGSHEDYEMSLPAGNHVFPFRFVLPEVLPGSFEGIDDCYVRYWLKTNIDKPWKFDHESVCMFTVVSVLDLNTLPEASAPAQSTETKTVCCLCCESGPITASFRIDKSGFVPGEAIVCNAEISDNTDRGTNMSRIKLVMLTIYSTHGGSIKIDKTDCMRVEHGPISPGGSDVWSNERLTVPPLPPSFLKGCDIIDITYYVELKVDVCDTPFDLQIPLSVFIGTIPLQSGVDLPPPSYQECVFGKVDTTDDDKKHAPGTMSKAPVYAYYDCLNPPTEGATAQPTAPPPAYGFS